VRIERIGLTPLKGTRHASHDTVELTGDGPVGDRAFCLVDRESGRVLRTVQNPSLVQAVARWDAGILSVDLPGRTVEGVPTPTGEQVKVDYWGRVAQLEIVDGPWAAAFSEHLGYDVALGRALHAGEVVYGSSVTLLTTSSLRRLAAEVGRDVHDARFRSTFLLDTGDAGPHVEDSWVGREIRLGEATVLVRSLVPRCAVVDSDPVNGRRDVQVLRALGGYRHRDNEVYFGVDAVVSSPGRVGTGDQASTERG
jgi:uncharacterized protein YcbX